VFIEIRIMYDILPQYAFVWVFWKENKAGRKRCFVITNEILLESARKMLYHYDLNVRFLVLHAKHRCMRKDPPITSDLSKLTIWADVESPWKKLLASALDALAYSLTRDAINRTSESKSTKNIISFTYTFLGKNQFFFNILFYHRIIFVI